MFLGLLFVGVLVLIIIQSIMRSGSSPKQRNIVNNRRNDDASMSFMAASHLDVMNPHNPHDPHHHHHGGDSHHHSGNDCGSSWGGDSGHSGGGDSGGGDSGGGGCD